MALRFREEDFYEFTMGEVVDAISLDEGYMELLRVPSGWVLTRGFEGNMTSTFIPWTGKKK